MIEKIEPFPKSEVELRSAFWGQLSHVPEGDKIKECLQCGTCSGTCPVSYAMDITPRQTIALFRAGKIEDILHSRTIWICASCYSCTVRCPVGIKVTDTLYALKRTAMSRKIYPEKFPVHVLSKAFIDYVYKYGRNYEIGLVVRFLLKSNFVKLFTMGGMGLAMMRRGRLGMLPGKIKRINEVQAIIKRANQLGENQ
jgi:quinone-modifying oxidoreductase, subunit QmoC